MPRFRTADSYRPCRRVEAARLSGVCVRENHKVMSSRRGCIFVNRDGCCLSARRRVSLFACCVVVSSTPQR
jgi:hypothetical protein